MLADMTVRLTRNDVAEAVSMWLRENSHPLGDMINGAPSSMRIDDAVMEEQEPELVLHWDEVG